MSSPYVAGTAWVPTSGIDLVDDGDPAAVAGLVATDEAALDRTEQFTRPKLVALGSVPYVSNAGHFATDYNFMGVVTSTTVGDQYKCTLPLVQGATITSIDVIFLPKDTHAANPATPPAISLIRWSVAPDAVPGSIDIVDTASYAPATWPDYINGEAKRIEMTMTHVVDVEGYVYQLAVTDESGGSSIVGNAYIAYRVNYA